MPLAAETSRPVIDVERAYLDLEDWIDSNGWAGYDPFDIRGEDWYIRIFGGEDRASYYARAALYHLEKRLPQAALRKTLRVRPAINAKAVGLLASAWLERYRMTRAPDYLDRAEKALAWLGANRSPHSRSGIAWGYPFHWNSRKFLPRGTPSGVVTGVVGDAWLTHHELTGSHESLEVARGISRFMLEHLNRPVDTDDMLCFSYTPLDDFTVLNASLFSAAFLARLGSATGDEEMLAIARRAAAYVISEQNTDGSFWYWGSEPPSFIDHFHTGFVLRHLDTIMKLTSSDFIQAPLARGYEFYRTRLFYNGVPTNTHIERYPVDIHSCAEAMLCVAQLAPAMGGGELIGSVAQFSIDRMKHRDGYYVASLSPSYRNEIPYMRWGQAWMLLAFAKARAYYAS